MRRALLALVLSGAVSACAAIWGFQDAIDLRDAGIDATAQDEADSAVPFDSTVGEGGEADAGAASGDAASEGSSDGAGEGAPAPDLCAACAPAVPPNGWSGPFEMYQLESLLAPDGAAPGVDADEGPGALPTCGQDHQAWDTAIDLHALPAAPPAECSCSCARSPAVCSPPTASYFNDPLCRLPCTAPSTSIGNGCTATPAPPPPGCPNIHLEVSTALLDAGTCGVDAGVVRPPVSWQVTARLCAPTPLILSGGGSVTATCEAGTCVPAQDSVFESTYCIIFADTVACPESGYPVRHAYGDAGGPYYADSLDMRMCTPCGCGAPTGASCALEAGTATAMDAGVCTAPAAYSGCTDISLATTYVEATAVPVGGECMTVAEGGVPVGTVTPTTPYTICCTQ